MHVERLKMARTATLAFALIVLSGAGHQWGLRPPRGCGPRKGFPSPRKRRLCRGAIHFDHGFDTQKRDGGPTRGPAENLIGMRLTLAP